MLRASPRRHEPVIHLPRRLLALALALAACGSNTARVEGGGAAADAAASPRAPASSPPARARPPRGPAPALSIFPAAPPRRAPLAFSWAPAAAAAATPPLGPPPAATVAGPWRALAPPAPLATLATLPRGEGAPPDAAIAVIFDRAMATSTVPAASLTPALPGAWRWEGDRALVFLPEGRLPGATRFRAAVPAGLGDAAGGRVDGEVAWELATAAPTLLAHAGAAGGPWLLLFDQAVDPGAVAASGAVVLPGATIPLRPLALTEPAAGALLAAEPGASPGAAVVVAPSVPLPPGTRGRLELRAGLASEEGPLTTPAAQGFDLETPAALTVVHARCGTGARCDPGDPLTITLSGALDLERFDPAALRVDPPLGELDARAAASAVIISGRTRPDTRYTVTLPPALADVAGQRLGAPATVPWEVGAAPPELAAAGGTLLVVPASSARAEGRGPSLSFTSRGHRGLRIVGRRVGLGDWDAFLDAAAALERGEEATFPGEVAIDQELAIADPSAATEVSVDLGPALSAGRGHVVVVVAPRDAAAPWYERERLVRWVEVTALSVDALPDRDALLAWVTDLRTGEPVAGAAVALAPGGVGAETGPDGLARLPLRATGDGPPPRARLVAVRGADSALLPADPPGLEGAVAWRRPAGPEPWRLLVFTGSARPERGAVAPVVGWARAQGQARHPALGRVRWEIRDGFERRLGAGVADVDATGAFAFGARLDRDAGPGGAVLRVFAEPRDGPRGAAAVPLPLRAELPPAARVAIAASPPRAVAGEPVTIGIVARRADGGPLGGAAVVLEARARPLPAGAPAGWTGWEGAPLGVAPGPAVADERAQAVGVTGAAGEATLGLTLPPAADGLPREVALEAVVTGADGTVARGAATVAVAPASLRLGVALTRGVVGAGEAAEAQIVVSDAAGVGVSGQALRVAVRPLWGGGEGAPDELITAASTSGEGRAVVPLGPLPPGPHRVRVTTSDGAGRVAGADALLWWLGGSVEAPPDALPSLFPAVPEATPGAPLALARFTPAPGGSALVVVTSAGRASARVVPADAALELLTVDVPADAAGSVELTWLQAGAGPRGRASLRVPVARPAERLAVGLTRDGDAVTAVVSGAGAASGVTLAVLGGDDAALAAVAARFAAARDGAASASPLPLRRLTELFAPVGELGPRPPDALLTTYGARPAPPLDVVAMTRARGAGAAPAVTVPVEVPVCAVAFGRDAAGIAAPAPGDGGLEATVEAPVVARVGDLPEVGVRLAQRAGAGALPATVRAELRAGGGARAAAGLELVVPPDRALVVAGEVGAPLGEGPLAIAIGVEADKRSRRLEATIPADPAPTAPAVVTFEGAQGPRAAPISLAWPRAAARVVVTVSRAEEAALAGAVDALFEARGGGTALLGWRLLAVAGGPGRDEPALRAAAERALAALRARQTDDGGFGAWAADGAAAELRGQLDAAVGVGLAGDVRLALPPALVAGLRRALRAPLELPAGAVATELDAIRLFARAHLGDADRRWARALVAASASEGLTPVATGLLAAVLGRSRDSRREARVVGRRLLELAPRDGGGVRGDAALLIGLTATDGPDALRRALVARLLAARAGGRWERLGDGAWAVYAITRELATRRDKRRADLGQLDLWRGADPFASLPLPPAGRWRRVAVPAGGEAAAEGIIVRLAGGAAGFVRADGFGADPGATSVVRRYLDATTGAPLPRDDDGAWLATAGQRLRVVVDVPLADGEGGEGLVVVEPVPGGLRAVPGTLSAPWRALDAGPGLVGARLEGVVGGLARLSFDAFAATRGRYAAPHTQVVLDEARALIRRGGDAVIEVR